MENPTPLPWQPGRNRKLLELTQHAGMIINRAKLQGFRMDTDYEIEAFRRKDEFYQLARQYFILKYGREPSFDSPDWMERERDWPLSREWREAQARKPKG